MEKHQVWSFRQRRKKVQFSTTTTTTTMRNNAGVEGVIVFGALAIVSLVAAFTFNKGRKHCNKDTMNLEATDSCRKEQDEGEGLRFILQDSSSSPTLHQNSCCTATDNGTSEIGNTPIENWELIATQSLISEGRTIHCGKKDSNSLNGDQEIVISDAEEETIPMTEEIPVVKNETNDSSVMKTIHVETEDEAVDADAKQSAEETSTLQSWLSSDSVPSIEEEKCLPKQSSFSSEEEEEYSLVQPSFSTEVDEDSPMRSSFSTEKEQEGSSPMESSVSAEEETKILEEESSEETGSSSAESNMEAIWPAELLGVLSPVPKEMDISQKLEEKDTTATIEAYHDKSGTEELMVMDDRKQHLAEAAKMKIWVWLGLVLLLILLANFLLQPHHLANSVSFGFPMNMKN